MRWIVSTMVLISLIGKFSATAQTVFQNTENRYKTSLNGQWHYIIDPYETGYYDYRYQPREWNPNFDPDAFFNNTKATDKTSKLEYDFDLSPTIAVPGDWNSQDEKLLYYEGTVWYKKSFDYQKQKEGNRLFINFGAANYRADVYLNGTKLGFHEGGFTPFYFEITDVVREKDNFLIIKVDNKRKKEAVPTLNTDWWNYGGLTRDVDLIETGSDFIADYKLQLRKGNSKIIEGFVKLDGGNVASREVLVAIPELNIKEHFTTNTEGVADFTFEVKSVSLWSLGNPKLYNVILTMDQENVVDQIGFRTIEVKGTEVLLNGEPVFLKGICIHEENPLEVRRAKSKEDAQLLLGWAKELGCNFVRLAHYPHNEYMARLADEMGLMLWEENPVYWTVSFDNGNTYETAKMQLTELIERDKNRASVVVWSMANETPHSEARLTFLKGLAAQARRIDPTRLISAALEVTNFNGDPSTKTISDPFSEYVDILSFNQYVGWYGSLPDATSGISWRITQQKPVFISEFGGGAKYGFHGDSLTRWSEEYQEDLYEKSITMLEAIPQLRGMSPWILVDFRSPKRLLPGIQDGWNRKGLISNKGERKKAYYVMKKYYERK